MTTAFSGASKGRSRAYRKIPIEARLQLVSLVQNRKFAISKAASTLKIALSTAKLIIKRYRQTGTYFLRVDERRKFKKMIGNGQNVEESLAGGPVEPSQEGAGPHFQTELEEQMPLAEPVFAPLVYYFQPFAGLENFCFWSIY